jgi:hypothetical protein
MGNSREPTAGGVRVSYFLALFFTKEDVPLSTTAIWARVAAFVNFRGNYRLCRMGPDHAAVIALVTVQPAYPRRS